jgi:hypothetical protein
LAATPSRSTRKTPNKSPRKSSAKPIPSQWAEALDFLREEDFDVKTNARGEARAYYNIAYDDFVDWAELVEKDIMVLPIPWQARAQVNIAANKKLAQYLKDTKGTRAKNAFSTQWRYCKAWPFTVAFAVEGAYKIERLGWVPQSVSVYLRAIPKKEEKPS